MRDKWEKKARYEGKFEKQILEGGPITVTHQSINRYFMSITEASELVIQASAMAKKCEFFVI